jgi:polyhydroxybutyrate depolymerase
MTRKKFYFALFFAFFHFACYSQNDSLKGGELYQSNFLIDGIQRNFIYYIPLNYGKQDMHPLIIFLHAENGNGKSIIKNYGNAIQLLADSSDAIVIYPDAVNGNWNDKMEGNSNATDTINDVGFISILIDYFRQVYGSNPSKVYVAGLFHGGKLAYRLSCDIPTKITALAPFTPDMKELGNKCNSNKSVAIMNTDAFVDSSTKKLNTNAIEEMWKFFMSKAK